MLLAASVSAGLALSACSNEDALGAGQDNALVATAHPKLQLTAAQIEARRILVKEDEEQRAQEEMQKIASAAMADTLFDPASAQYRALQKGRDGAICGKVNAKNRYGAYVGFRDFVVPKSRKTVYVSEHNDRIETEKASLFTIAFVLACATKEEEAAYTSTLSVGSSDSSAAADDDLALETNLDSNPDPFAD